MTTTPDPQAPATWFLVTDWFWDVHPQQVTGVTPTTLISDRGVERIRNGHVRRSGVRIYPTHAEAVADLRPRIIERIARFEAELHKMLESEYVHVGHADIVFLRIHRDIAELREALAKLD